MELQTFNFNVMPVRVVTMDGEPWFVATDVALILGYQSTKDATRLLDDDEKGGHILPTPGGAQELTVVSESGLYNLILRSRKPEARPFRKWVTGEVLPGIRKTGSYVLAPQPTLPQSMPEALRQLADSLEAEAKAKAALELAAPKIEAFDALMDSGTTYLVREAAKLLGIGQNRLYAFMRQQGIMFPHSCEPYQEHLNAGRFVVKTVPYLRGGQPASSKTTHVTARGLEYLRRKLAALGMAA